MLDNNDVESAGVMLFCVRVWKLFLGTYGHAVIGYSDFQRPKKKDSNYTLEV